MSKKNRITVKPDGRTIKGTPEETVKSALERSGYFFPNNCGGKGRCLSCRVEYSESAPLRTKLESRFFPNYSSYRMACQHRLTEDISISLAGQTLFENSKLIEDINLAGGGDGYGIAVDIGTTLIAIYLADLRDGKLIAQYSFLNPQVRYGGDVMSRLDFAKQPSNRKQLTRTIHKRSAEVIGHALTTRAIERDEVTNVYVVGNSAMTQLWLGMSGGGLERAPFRSPLEGRDDLSFNPKLVGLSDKCAASACPILAGYVGGDTVAAIVATDLDKRPGNRLLIDFGTNGEIVLSSNGKLTATSTAAGPAFEGVGMRCGMPAVAGAIDSFDSDCIPHIIGEELPVGFCGSGYIAALSMLLRRGTLIQSGLLKRNANGDREWSPMFSSVPKITQDDVRQFQLAKGAIAAGVAMLCRGEPCVSPSGDIDNSEDRIRTGRTQGSPLHIDEIILTGSFGSRIDPQAAINIGLIPDISPDRIKTLDNAAGRGAVLYLNNEGYRRRAADLQKAVTVLNLGEMPDFQDLFVENMSFGRVR